MIRSLSRRRRLAAADGFTLVEVLVVILIIGVLATLALSAFLNQRAKAQDTGAKAAATTAAKAMIVLNGERETFEGATPEALIAIEPALVQARGLSVDGFARTFTVSVDSPSGAGVAFAIERLASGEYMRTCTQPGKGSCQSTADAQGNQW